MAAHRYICLLRGVNVGGHAKLPMAQLREVCESLGCTDVVTYVQSGNVVLTSDLPAERLAQQLSAALAPVVGIAPPVMVRTHAELVGVLENNPYPDTPPNFLHVGFLGAKPSASALAELGEVDCSPESYTVAGKEIYLDYVQGAGRSKKLGRIAFERRLGVQMTARNLRTVAKLVELSG